MSSIPVRRSAVALAVATALGVSSLASVAVAQDSGAEPAATLEEVTVTAQARESLQDVPISITAFSAESIEKANIYDIRDVVKLSPNVNLQSTGGNGTGASCRT